jgi:galactarate dehydratase
VQSCPSGPTLREHVPQGHKVALVDIANSAPVRRYNAVIGYAAQALPAGSWVNEQRLVMPTPPVLEGLPIATNNAPLAAKRAQPIDSFGGQGLSPAAANTSR